MSAPSSTSETIRFPVRGMTCGSCVNRIMRAVQQVDGVTKVSVDLRQETTTVRREPALVSNEALAAAVARAGYAADVDRAVVLPPGAGAHLSRSTPQETMMDSNQQQEHSARTQTIPSWFVLAVAIVALVVGAVALTATLSGRSASFSMMGAGGGGMMGARSAAATANGPQPGDAGFVAGTAAAPRTIRITAGPGYVFAPSAVTVERGETITFVVTTMGPTTHEFMVGPADAVAAGQEGTPEVADIGMMQTKSITYTFDGAGPYAFACHATGHYEAGMRGTITIVGS